MRISCSTVCCVSLPLENVLEKISAAGFENLELLAVRGWAHIDAEKSDPARISELCQDYHLTLTTLHAGELNALSDNTLTDSMDYIKSVIDLTRELAIDKIVFTGGPRSGSVLGRYIKGMQELTKYVDGKRINLCVENHYNNQIETIEDMRTIVTQIDHPQVGLTVDTGHFTSSGIPLEDVVEQLGSNIKHVHIKDHKGTKNVKLGTGYTNNKKFVKQLKELGYQGELSMESEVNDKAHVDIRLREGYEYMRNLVGSP